jgi:hypothetical protein
VTEVSRRNGRKVFSWFSWRMEELRKTHEGGFTLIELMAVVYGSFTILLAECVEGVSSEVGLPLYGA